MKKIFDLLFFSQIDVKKIGIKKLISFHHSRYCSWDLISDIQILIHNQIMDIVLQKSEI